MSHLLGFRLAFVGLLLAISSSFVFASGNPPSLPQVDLFSGALNYSIPIETPPGRNGMQPNLALTYHSGRRNDWVGVGWDLSVGAIQLNTKRGIDYSGNEFLFNGAELVQIVPGEYQFKIENEFLRIVKLPAVDGRITWEATDKTGKRYFYGQESASRQADPANADRIFKWCLDKVIDTHGNYMSYSYSKDQGQIYLDRIDYAGNEIEGVPPTNYVKFYLEEREDRIVSNNLLFGVNTSKRLKSIAVYSNSGVFRLYNSLYNFDKNANLPAKSINQKSLLSSVETFGVDSQIDADGVISGGEILSSVDLKSELGAESFSITTLSTPKTSTDLSAYTPVVGDFSGDGLVDAAWLYQGTKGARLYASLSQGDGTFNDAIFSTPNTTADFSAYMPYVADFSGDGLVDVAWIYNGTKGGRLYTSLSHGDGSFIAATLSTPNTTADLSEYMPFVGDFSGDGLADVAWIYNGSKGARLYTSLNQGDGTFDNDNATLSTPNTTADLSEYMPYVADFSGDGLADVAWIYNGSKGGRLYTALNNGDGTFSEATLSTPNTTADLSEYMPFVGDFSGDGLADVAWIYNGSKGGRLYTALNNGDGTFSEATFSAPKSTADLSLFMPSVGDFSGDGLIDVAWVYNGSKGGRLYTSLSRGDGTFSDAAFSTPNTTADLSLFMPSVGDFSGDSLADVAWIYKGTKGGRLHASINASKIPDILNAITTQMGATTTIDYTPSSAYNNTQLPFPVQTVNSITTDDGNGVSSTTSYEFSGGFHHIGERDFRGFNYVKVTGAEGPNGERIVSETWYHQGNDVAVDVNDPYVDAGYMKGKPYRQRTSDQNGSTLSETTTIYTDDADSVAPFFAPLEQVDSSICDGDACGLQTRAGYVFNEFGNLTTEYRYGDISTAADDSTLIKEYATNESAHILALLAKETLYDGSGNMKSQVDYYYDGPSDCSTPATSQVPVKGNLSRIVRWLDAKTAGTPADVEARMGYDAYGNLLCSVDAKGNKSTTVYDATHTFPVKEIDPLGNQALTSYYGVGGIVADKGLYGQVKTVTDPNGASTTTEYDVFGRTTLETLSDGSWQSWAYNNFGTVGSQHVATTNNFGLWSESYFDGFGRTIKERSRATEGKVSVTLTEYDSRGNVTRSSLPHFEEDPAYYVTTQFDAVGRPKQIAKPDGSSGQICYNDGVTVSIDANQHRRRETRDAFGQLVKVEEYAGTYSSCSIEADTPYATTSYNYDILGNLRFVTDTKGNQTEMRYDSLGRKTYMDDPDMGIWTYDYDPKGNLVSQQDAKGQIVSFAYDTLDRITLKNYADPAETDTHYYYDETGHGFAKGKLTRMTDASGVTSYNYNNALARSVTMSKTIDGSSYSITTTTDALGRTDSVQYPDNKVAGYTYADGLLKDVIYDGATYASFSDYNAQGQMQKVTYGNGIVTDYNYEPDSGMLWTIGVSKGSTKLLDNEYVYDNKGNITDIFNYADLTKSQNFGYDALDRLVSADSPKYGTLAYSYDEIGNIVTKGGLIYTPDSQRPHALGSITGGRSFSYDGNGNTLSDGLRTYDWNVDNKPKSITKDGATTSFVYDGIGQRVKKVGPSGTTLYISPLYEITGGSPAKYIFANGKRLALVRETLAPLDTLYYHQDHLGSTGVVTDALGNKVEDIFYKPFGEAVGDEGTLSVNHKYTGQELDQDTGLYNYNARLYDPVVGKFVSADAIVPQPDTPQAFNRYAYCLNNPVIYVDPSGHFISLTAVVVGAVIGAISAGIQSDWDLKATVTGAVIGAVSGAAYSGVSTLLFDVVKNEIALATIAGAVSGATAGAMSTAIYGGNAFKNISQGAMYGAIGGFAFGAVSASGLNQGTGWRPEMIAAHGIISGGLAEAQGGDFALGFGLAAGAVAMEYCWEYLGTKTSEMTNDMAAGRTVHRDLEGKVWAAGTSGQEGGNGNLYDTIAKFIGFKRACMESQYSSSAKAKAFRKTEYGLFVNDTSYIHDPFNAFGYGDHGYIDRSYLVNTLFETYSFVGMPVAGALTAFAHSSRYYQPYFEVK